MALHEDVKGLPNYAKLEPQTSNPLGAGEPGVYVNADDELVLHSRPPLMMLLVWANHL
jgi:hypothetical protein